MKKEINKNDEVWRDTKTALLIAGNLKLEQFIAVNQEIFESIKGNDDCFCALHNAFVYANEAGLKFTMTDLEKFYDYCGGKQKQCFNLIDAISQLAESEEVKTKFYETCSIALKK